MTYDANRGEFKLNPTGTGGAYSPKIFTGGKRVIQVVFEAMATYQSSLAAPNSSAHLSSWYFAADQTTPATSTAGYQTNGHAGCRLPPNVWTTCVVGFSLGPNIQWMEFAFNNAPTTYTSDNIYRNIRIELFD